MTSSTSQEIVILEALRKDLAYDPETGSFIWATSRPHVVVGRSAGCIGNEGYLKIKYGKKQHLAHRLAWFIIHGQWPNGEIDHINGDKLDNRITNLRDVPGKVNLQNRRRPNKNNKTEFLGVGATGKRFYARLRANEVRLYLGSFDTAEAAHEAYVTAKRRLHEGCTI
ncbi:HNH endonuclease [compost metagenome]